MVGISGIITGRGGASGSALAAATTLTPYDPSTPQPVTVAGEVARFIVTADGKLSWLANLPVSEKDVLYYDGANWTVLDNSASHETPVLVSANTTDLAGGTYDLASGVNITLAECVGVWHIRGAGDASPTNLNGIGTAAQNFTDPNDFTALVAGALNIDQPARQLTIHNYDGSNNFHVLFGESQASFDASSLQASIAANTTAAAGNATAITALQAQAHADDDVEGVTGTAVDNTDPRNPVIDAPTASDIQALETTTAISIASNILTYTDEDGNDTNIDLSLYLDDSNLARLTSGVLNGTTGIATFTRDDASAFTVDFSAFLSDLVFTGADGTTAGGQGDVPAPAATDNKKVLYGDATWAAPHGTHDVFTTEVLRDAAFPVADDIKIGQTVRITPTDNQLDYTQEWDGAAWVIIAQDQMTPFVVADATARDALNNTLKGFLPNNTVYVRDDDGCGQPRMYKIITPAATWADTEKELITTDKLPDLPLGAVIGGVGHSLMAHGKAGSTDGNSTYHGGNSILAWTCALLHQRVNHEIRQSGVQGEFDGHNQAISGSTSDTLRAQIDLLPKNTKICVIKTGVNDLTTATNTKEQLLENTIDAACYARARNMLPIVMNIDPSSDLAVVEGYVDGGGAAINFEYTAPVLAQVNWVNTQLRQRYGDGDVFLLADSFFSKSDINGRFLDTDTDEGRHNKPKGAYADALILADILDSLLPPADNRFRPNQTEVYDATDNPTGNLLPNPTFQGNGGTLGADVTGEVPDDWRFERSDSGAGVSGVSAVCSILTSPSGTFRLLRVDFTCDGAGDRREFRLRPAVANTTIPETGEYNASMHAEYGQSANGSNPLVMQYVQLNSFTGNGWFYRSFANRFTTITAPIIEQDFPDVDYAITHKTPQGIQEAGTSRCEGYFGVHNRQADTFSLILALPRLSMAQPLDLT